MPRTLSLLPPSASRTLVPTLASPHQCSNGGVFSPCAGGSSFNRGAASIGGFINYNNGTSQKFQTCLVPGRTLLVKVMIVVRGM